MESTIAIKLFAEGALYISLFITTLYALIFGYHWFNYGSTKKTSTTALIIYLSGAGILMFGLLISYLAL